MIKRIDKKIIFLIAILFIIIFIVEMNTMNCDKQFHLERLDELAKQIKNIGLLKYPYYINFDSFGGMGYALEIFYSDFFLILPAILSWFLNLNLIYSITIILSFLLIVISSFVAYKHFYNNVEDAIYYSIIYTFSNFILFEIVERNALGTNFAYVFIPWIILSFIDILETKNIENIFILGISMACLLLSHIQTAIIVTIGLIIYLLMNIKEILKDYRLLLEIIMAALICLLIDAFFIFPILEQTLSQKLYFVRKYIYIYEKCLYKFY